MSQPLTQYATHANVIADTVRAAFAAARVGGCAVELTAPEGSTLGGKLALQHVTLKGEHPSPLVVGSVDAGRKVAKVRSYREVARMHEERFKAPAPFDEATYLAFTKDLEGVLSAFGISMALEVSPPEAVTAEPIPEQPPPWRRPPVLAGAAALIVVLVIALMAGLR
jgi:hypothetical protein